MLILKIKKEDEGKRLDVFLKERYPNLSRSFIQKKIKNGEASVNGEVSSVHRFLKEDDELEIREMEYGEEGIKLIENKAIKKLRNRKIEKLNIISETDDYLVINKPCGMVAHQGEQNENNTLADILVEQYPQIKNVGEDFLRPGIVHRLDKDVSGVMVVAKTQNMFICLKNQFQERTAEKEYVALVYGIVKKLDGVIDFPIGRSKSNGTKMAARPLNQGGREAITEFTVLQYLAKWTILSIKIRTGRTHQIRVHLNAYGHPIVGDKVYKPKKLKPTLKFGNRLMLHSWKLGFRNLNDEWKEFEANLPAELRQILTGNSRVF
ncbi:MAG: RluA family pseudouridine synthase [bacterium]